MKRKPIYSLVDVLMASATEPIPAEKRDYQLLLMNSALAEIETAPDVKPYHWRALADCVNLLETMCEMGVAVDTDGAIQDVSIDLQQAAARYMHGQPLRMSGPGIQKLRGVLEDYKYLLEVLPARTVIAAHRKTEKRIFDIQRGKAEAHDVVVI